MSTRQQTIEIPACLPCVIHKKCCTSDAQLRPDNIETLTCNLSGLHKNKTLRTHRFCTEANILNCSGTIPESDPLSQKFSIPLSTILLALARTEANPLPYRVGVGARALQTEDWCSLSIPCHFQQYYGCRPPAGVAVCYSKKRLNLPHQNFDQV